MTDPPRLAARCDPANYLDRAPPERSGEDNADFHDRSDARRPGNANGFIQGPIEAGGVTAVNDRLVAIGHGDVMPRVMKRVALELAQCLAFYASRPENAGRLPPPAPACGAAAPFGRLPDTPFDAAPGMLVRWWRHEPRVPEALAELPTESHACRIALAPSDAGTRRTLPPGSPAEEGGTAGVALPAWWTSWKPFVFYAPASGYVARAATPGCAQPGACIDLVDGEGHAIAAARRAAIVVAATPGGCETPRLRCGPVACTEVVTGNARGHRHDAVITLP
jgi:hypothetical protein